MNTKERILEAYERGFRDGERDNCCIGDVGHLADLLEDDHNKTAKAFLEPFTPNRDGLAWTLTGEVRQEIIEESDGFYNLYMHKAENLPDIWHVKVASGQTVFHAKTEKLATLYASDIGLRPESERPKQFTPNRDGLAWKLLNKGQREAVETSEGTYTITLSYDARGGYDLWCNHVCLLERVLDTDAAKAFAEDLGLKVQCQAQIRASCVQGHSTEYNLFLDGKEIFSSSDKGEVLKFAKEKGLEL